MPILGNVLLEVDGPDRLRLAATDLFLSVSSAIPAKVDKGGSIAVGARDLFERIRMMPDGQVNLTSTDGTSLSVKAVGTARRFSIHGISAEEFPSLPQPDTSSAPLMLPVSTVSALIQSTQFSISTDDSRLALNSALVECDGQQVRMVTTDGHRLTRAEALVPGLSAQLSLLIPLKGVQQLKRICDDAASEAARSETEKGGEPTLAFTQQGPNAFFKVGSLNFSVKLVDAQFPPYEQVIPQTSEFVVRVPRVAVAEALRAVSVAASDRTGGVKLILSRDTLKFETESPESGQGFDEVSISYDGPEIAIGFNSKYFLDVTSAITDEDILLGLGGDLDPAVIRPASNGETFSLLAVVMPMRI